MRLAQVNAPKWRLVRAASLTDSERAQTPQFHLLRRPAGEDREHTVEKLGLPDRNPVQWRLSPSTWHRAAGFSSVLLSAPPRVAASPSNPNDAEGSHRATFLCDRVWMRSDVEVQLGPGDREWLGGLAARNSPEACAVSVDHPGHSRRLRHRSDAPGRRVQALRVALAAPVHGSGH